MLESTRPHAEEEATQRLRDATANITNALASGRDLGFNSRKLSALFGENSECIFLKDCNGRIVYSNESHDQLYASQLSASTVGLESITFLHPSMIELSLNSDAMLINGCQKLKFQHVVGQPDGRGVKTSSVKLPLLGADGKVQGIIGLSKPLIPLARQVISSELEQLGGIFNNLRPEEKQVARFVCNGVSYKKIAGRLDTPLRTVENRRRSVLKKLNIESTAELIKIMVRLEDAGLIHLGV